MTAALAVTACAGDGANGAALRDGPLQEPSAHAWAYELPVGTVFTDGLETLDLAGSKPATLVDVTLVGDPGLQLVGVSLAGPERPFASIQLIEQFPPQHRDLPSQVLVADALGHQLTPLSVDDMGWQLLLGIKVAEPGRHVRSAVEVTYEVDGDTYIERLPAALAICGSEDGATGQDCDLPPLPES